MKIAVESVDLVMRTDNVPRLEVTMVVGSKEYAMKLADIMSESTQCGNDDHLFDLAIQLQTAVQNFCDNYKVYEVPNEVLDK